MHMRAPSFVCFKRHEPCFAVLRRSFAVRFRDARRKLGSMQRVELSAGRRSTQYANASRLCLQCCL